MPQTFKRNEWPGDRPKCINCGYVFGGENGKKKDLIFRRLLAYTANGVPITELLCQECAEGAPAEQKVSLDEAAS